MSQYENYLRNALSKVVFDPAVVEFLKV